MKQQHRQTMSVDFRLEFPPVEPVPEHVVIVRPRPVQHQRHLRHEVFRVRFDIAHDGEVPPGIRDVHVDDFTVLAGCLQTKSVLKNNRIYIYSIKT